MPAPPQIMWAAPSTHPSAITAFVMRAALFPKMRFAVIAVNRLGVPAREALMRAILTRRGRRADLALVFTEASGQTSLSLVMRREEMTTNAGLLTAKQIRGYRGPASTIFSDVILVAGESGSGKSTWIKREADKRVGSRYLISVAVHNELDVAGIMEAVKGIKQGYAKIVEAAISNHSLRCADIAASTAAAATVLNAAVANGAAVARAPVAPPAAVVVAPPAAAHRVVVQAAQGMPATWACHSCTVINPWANESCATCDTQQVGGLLLAYG
jgi:hypothetical protein